MTAIASAGEFREALKHDRVIADFHATWCGPCQEIAPYFEELRANCPQIVFLKVNSDECEELSEKYAIKALPTFIVFKGGKELGRVSGGGRKRLDDLLAMLKAAE